MPIPTFDTVQINPYLIYSGDDSRRDDSIIRSTTQASLRAAHGSHSIELLHRMKAQMQPQLAALKMEIRASPAVQADETGWQENGSNGYIWSVSTPSVRYYEYHHSRAGEVVKHLIGEDFGGVLGSDFYAGYNIHQGMHQRCWVHFLRDAHEIKEKFPYDEELFTWAASVKAIYDAAVAWAEHGPDPHISPRNQSLARVAQQHAYAQHLWQLCQPYVGTATPQHTLCERVERFLPELFVFVAVPGVPAHKENDKQLPAGSQKKTSVKDFPEVFLTRLRQSHLYIFFYMKELMHFCGSHDVNHPEPGRRGPSHLRDLLTLIRLSALESVA